jgi:hypothetical protein
MAITEIQVIDLNLTQSTETYSHDQGSMESDPFSHPPATMNGLNSLNSAFGDSEATSLPPSQDYVNLMGGMMLNPNIRTPYHTTTVSPYIALYSIGIDFINRLVSLLLRLIGTSFLCGYVTCYYVILLRLFY